MPTFIEPPITTPPNGLVDDALAYLEGAIPGWQASPGNLDTLIIEAIAQPASETADLASAAMTSVFRYFGSLVGVNPIDAVSATAAVTFTVADTLGHTIPGGSLVALTAPDNSTQGFLLVDDVVIAPGATTGVGTVTAESEGTTANGLSGSANLVDVPPFVTAAVLTLTGNGLEAEDDDTYLNRLSETLTLLTPRPIMPPDYAILARSIAGVARAAVVDNLKPSSTSGAIPTPVGAESTNTPLVVTVSPVDVNGLDVGATIRGQVSTLLNGDQNMTAYVVAPQYQSVDVTVTVKAWDGVDLTDLHDRVVAALSTYLSPAGYGLGPTGSSSVWINEPVLRLSTLFQVVEAVSGVRYATGLTFGLHGGALGTTDVTMAAASAVPVLPTNGTFSVTTVP